MLEADGLEVDEALLTGAADPVLKRPGDDVMSGSSVVSGSGALAVKRISRDTRAARPAEKAARFTPVESELRDGVTTLVRYATYAMIPAGIALFMHQLTIGGGDVPEAARRMVAGVVPVVPDGLVLLASAAFAGSVVRLGKRKCLVRNRRPSKGSRAWTPYPRHRASAAPLRAAGALVRRPVRAVTATATMGSYAVARAVHGGDLEAQRSTTTFTAFLVGL